ncbi:hypothetical protein Pmani_015277 [Petrolisthes manimaculis]|uniref:Uncharacterized protein n=1 Tax=Petrolisthes manimaculis TaxID=1843537 RepID=A0AAE1U7T5_9EUCA|nr:hypothetical protein Pmani_015277 [Petrolisthes manimaculis]
MDHAPVITKRRMEHDSNTNSDPVSSAAKTSRCNEAATVHEAPDPSLPPLINLAEPSVAVHPEVKMSRQGWALTTLTPGSSNGVGGFSPFLPSIHPTGETKRGWRE